MDIDKIGKYIKEQREKLNLTQSDLGDKVHVTRQAVSSWENGKTIPDSEMLLKLSEIFSVTINEILGAETIEKATLELVNENNKKSLKIKKLMISFLFIIILLVLSILSIYFINNYNSIQVYKISGRSNNFKIRDGIVISAAGESYFKLGDILVDKDEIQLKKMKLYYLQGKKKITIYQSDLNSQFFEANLGYHELSKTKFNKIKDKIYVEIQYDDSKKETLKISLKELYQNDFSSILEQSKVIRIEKRRKEQEEQLKLLTEMKDKTYKQNVKIRNKEITKNDKETYHTPYIIEDKINPETQPEEEPPKAEDKIEPIEEEPKEEEKTTVPEINYEEIINLIRTYGVNENGSYKIEFTHEDGSYVSISEVYEVIEIMIINNNIIEQYTYKNTEGYEVRYIKYENYIIKNSEKINLYDLNENDKQIVEKMNHYLSLIYKEIEERQVTLATNF